MLIKSKVARVEQSMTTLWKEERWGHNIYQNEQKQFFGLDPPPIPLLMLSDCFGDYTQQHLCCIDVLLL